MIRQDFISAHLVAVFVIYPLIKYMFFPSPEERERRNIQIAEERKRRERERLAREKELQIAKEQKEFERLRQREEEMSRYRQLQKEIEATPQYEIWRQAVLEKFGRKCAICGETESLEVDHRYQSFFGILKTYGIKNVIQAYRCPQLWDVNNGAPLCKFHHDQTPSSRKYLEKNYSIIK